MVKLEAKLKIKKVKIGILGGSFDPAHKGHLAISKEAKRRFNLKNSNLHLMNVKSIMTKNPVSIEKDVLAAKALSVMNTKKITCLCVHDKKKKFKMTYGDRLKSDHITRIRKLIEDIRKRNAPAYFATAVTVVMS